ncbi:MAG: hypothetical protein EZS28_009554 [Streblomastix strix]|uniref:Uncharacterized protein n=1 Tax=Streblomastix strix TaxID=222440 RepID=A0A5J4WK69_9EUKA|nr:MAG: hypothetical protein EZS28_009554 [Streblomastix strix]
MHSIYICLTMCISNLKINWRYINILLLLGVTNAPIKLSEFETCGELGVCECALEEVARDYSVRACEWNYDIKVCGSVTGDCRFELFWLIFVVSRLSDDGYCILMSVSSSADCLRFLVSF